MSTEIKKEIQLEIAHVLFIDIVGYSKLSINEQRAAVDELTQIVRATEQFQKAEGSERLIKIATGDGMALVFYTSPEAPVRCAVELSRVLKDHPQLRLRMGVHSGPVSGVIDVTGRTNLAGAGLNLAQRVMKCGDGGHILLSKHVAEDLEERKDLARDLHEQPRHHAICDRNFVNVAPLELREEIARVHCTSPLVGVEILSTSALKRGSLRIKSQTGSSL
jgi:class 3 adenylate cyclase